MAAPVINTPRTSNVASRRPMAGLWPLPNGGPRWSAGDRSARHALAVASRTGTTPPSTRVTDCADSPTTGPATASPRGTRGARWLT